MNDKKQKVLLIEDSPAVARLIRKMLTSERYALFDLEVASKLSSGLERLADGGIDAVLLDLGLPDSQGLDTLGRVCAEAPGMPVVVLTGLDDEKLGFQAVKMGAQDYLVKGQVNSNLLARSVRYAIERQRLQDIERKTRHLQKSEVRLRTIINGNADGIIVVDRDGVVCFVNQAAESLIDRKAEELVGELFGFPVAAGDAEEINLVRRDEEICVAEMRVVKTEWEGEPAYLVSMRDITEKKQAEEALRHSEAQLLQAQKLKAIGGLAAGIAHEINTPIQYIGDNTRFLKDSFDDMNHLLEIYKELLASVKGSAMLPDLVEKLEAAIKDVDMDFLTDEIPLAIKQSRDGVERVADIVRAMKDFAHPDPKEKVQTDIHKAIESTITVSRNEWKYVADVKTDFDPDIPMVPCLPGEFNQVILNMIVNAAHALADVAGDKPDGKGTIKISTRRRDDLAEIRISDTGPGIPENIQSRIFEPFFTTKEVGKGTGQGLSIANSVVVEKHGGTLSLESEKGKGTTFIICLPLENQIP